MDSVAVVDCIAVSDGDTWKFEIKGEPFAVCVLHVDCFETRHGTRLDGQAAAAGISTDSALALGKLAKALADSLMTGKKVTMVRDYDEDNLDAYGRLLRKKHNADRYITTLTIHIYRDTNTNNHRVYRYMS